MPWQFIAGGLLSNVTGIIPGGPGVMQFLQQSANATFTNKQPDITAVIAAYNRGHLYGNQAEWSAAANGVDWHPGDDADASNYWQGTWGGVSQLTKDVPPPNLIIPAYIRGQMSVDRMAELMQKTAGTTKEWYDIIDSFRYQIPPGQIMEAYNRRVLTEGQWNFRLKAYGGISKETRAILDWLRFQLPSMSDLIRFIKKESFDQKVVDELGYDEDYDKISAQVEKYGEALGYKTLGDASPGLDITTPITKLFYRADWTPISPTQAYNIYHRVRGDPMDPATWRVPGLKPFTYDDVKRWLRVADYPPKIRDYLVEISHPPITRVDLRRMVRVGFITKPREILERYMDLGYTQRDAQNLTDYTLMTETGVKPETEINKFQEAIYRSYKLGTISRPNAKTQVMAFWDEKVRPIREPWVNTRLNRIDFELNLTHASRAINALKDDVLEGAASYDDAKNQLLSMNVTQERTDQYLAAWQLDFTRPRRVAAAAKVSEWYQQRLISYLEAISRLRNLGYSHSDAELYLRSADVKELRRVRR